MFPADRYIDSFDPQMIAYLNLSDIQKLCLKLLVKGYRKYLAVSLSIESNHTDGVIHYDTPYVFILVADSLLYATLRGSESPATDKPLVFIPRSDSYLVDLFVLFLLAQCL